MSLSLVASVCLADSPAAWWEEIHPSAFMLPWFLLMIGTLPPSRAETCSVANPRAGWIMVATGLVLSILLLGAPLLVRLDFESGQLW